MPIYIELEDIETDYLYNKGIEKGIEKGQLEGEDKGTKMTLAIINAYKKGLGIEAIAETLGLEVAKVEQVIQEAKTMDLL